MALHGTRSTIITTTLTITMGSVILLLLYDGQQVEAGVVPSQTSKNESSFLSPLDVNSYYTESRREGPQRSSIIRSKRGVIRWIKGMWKGRKGKKGEERERKKKKRRWWARIKRWLNLRKLLGRRRKREFKMKKLLDNMQKRIQHNGEFIGKFGEVKGEAENEELEKVKEAHTEAEKKREEMEEKVAAMEKELNENKDKMTDAQKELVEAREKVTQPRAESSMGSEAKRPRLLGSANGSTPECSANGATVPSGATGDPGGQPFDFNGIF